MTRPTATPTRTARIGPRSAGVVMSAEEFDSLRDECWARGSRYELINGVLVVSPSPGRGERGPNDVLAQLLLNYRDLHPEGVRLDATYSEETLATTPNRRRCDRAIWVGLGREPDLDGDVPAIVVEFVSKRKRDFIRDYETKRDEYLRFGVREYWVVDRFRRAMTVHRSIEAAPRYSTTIVDEAGEHTTDLLPGFVLPLRLLLPKAAGPSDTPRQRRDRN